MITSEKNLERLTESFLNEGLTAGEQTELQKLLKVPENKEYFKKMYVLWYNAQYAVDNDYVEKALQKALFRIEEKEKQQYRREKMFEWYHSFWKIAAAILIAFTLGAVSYHIVDSRKQSGSSSFTSLATSKVSVPLGSLSMVELPDGTSVTLNAGSNLHYRNSYGQGSREVWLEGEGYFKVVKNAAIPFIVNAKNVTIKALGTEFNVKAYPEEKIVQTTLVNGIVTVKQINAAGNFPEIMLKPKQMVTIYEQTATANTVHNDSAQRITNLQPDQTVGKPAIENVELKEDINTALYISWKDPRWVFESEPLSDLAMKLQRRYDVKIIITEDALKQYPFNGILTDETLEQVLDIMKSIAPINYSINKKTVTLSMNTRHKKYFDALMK